MLIPFKKALYYTCYAHLFGHRIGKDGTGPPHDPFALDQAAQDETARKLYAHSIKLANAARRKAGEGAVEPLKDVLDVPALEESEGSGGGEGEGDGEGDEESGKEGRGNDLADHIKVAKQKGAVGVLTWLSNCVDQGIWVPVEIVIARPFIEHFMLSGIVTVAGRDTGATLFGPADM